MSVTLEALCQSSARRCLCSEVEGDLVFVHLATHLLFTRSSIRARLINRGQRRESDIDAVGNCASCGWLTFREMAQLTSPCTVAEGSQHVSNRLGCWTACCSGPGREYSPRAAQRSRAFSCGKLV